LAYTIAEPCIGVKDASCVEVCPVDCIHPGQNEPGFQETDQLYIDPNECIDCGACEEACPVTAIFENDAVPEQWAEYKAKNAEYFTLSAAEFENKYGSPGRPGA
jgi:NAD-dependent dihydropyrimidine dehydrogenase PreA subunit